MKNTLILLVLMLMAGGAFAQQDMPLEQRQKLADIEKAITSIDKLKVIIDEMSQARKQECLKAFGHTKFCGCIAENVPVALTFQQYISVVTHSKAENNYSSLSKDEKKIYDLTGTARDQCVKQL